MGFRLLLPGLAVAVASACGRPPPISCEEAAIAALVCVPDGGVVPAGVSIKLQVAAVGFCGTGRCRVSVSSETGIIDVRLDAVCAAASTTQALSPPSADRAVAPCLPEPVVCDVPPLAPGDYSVRSPFQPQVRLQAADAGVSSCELDRTLL